MARPPKIPAHEWRRLLDEQVQSGVAFGPWVLSRGLVLGTAYRWRRALARAEAATMPTERSPSFVPVRVVSSSPTSSPTSVLRVHVVGGRAVDVPDAFDDDHLRRVVLVLESLSCS